MKKQQILTMVTLSTLVLSGTGLTAFADEVTVGETQTEVVTETGDSGITVDTPSTPVAEPMGGEDSGVVIGSDDEGVPSVPVDDEPGITVDTPSTPDTSSSQTSEPSEVEEKDEDSSRPQTEAVEQQEESQESTVEVPTTDDSVAVVDTDKTTPTNNPNVSAQTAYEAGASQVGTTSLVTGQIVQDVTVNQPVVLASGLIITDIQEGVATLSDGSAANMSDLEGVAENEDGTYSAVTVTGENVTLPETGENDSLKLILFGLVVFMAGLWLNFKSNIIAFFKKVVGKLSEK